jgi:hypothetical protein
MSRCQRRTVSGVTSSRSPWRRAFGVTPSRVASRARSAQFRFGRRAEPGRNDGSSHTDHLLPRGTPARR